MAALYRLEKQLYAVIPDEQMDSINSEITTNQAKYLSVKIVCPVGFIELKGSGASWTGYVDVVTEIIPSHSSFHLLYNSQCFVVAPHAPASRLNENTLPNFAVPDIKADDLPAIMFAIEKSHNLENWYEPFISLKKSPLLYKMLDDLSPSRHKALLDASDEELVSDIGNICDISIKPHYQQIAWLKREIRIKDVEYIERIMGTIDLITQYEVKRDAISELRSQGKTPNQTLIDLLCVEDDRVKLIDVKRKLVTYQFVLNKTITPQKLPE